MCRTPRLKNLVLYSSAYLNLSQRRRVLVSPQLSPCVQMGPAKEPKRNHGEIRRRYSSPPHPGGQNTFRPGSRIKISLLDLPNELLLSVADNLDRESDISAFSRLNRRLYLLLNLYLYQHNIKQTNSSGLIWAAEHGRETIVQRFLSEGADIQSTRR